LLGSRETRKLVRPLANAPPERMSVSKNGIAEKKFIIHFPKTQTLSHCAICRLKNIITISKTPLAIIWHHL